MTSEQVQARAGGVFGAPLPQLARRMALASGWRRAGIALALGLLAAGAMPPFNLVPLLFIAFPGLVWLIDGRLGWRGAFADGFLWGLGFYVPSLYWTTEAMFVDIAQFWWMVPFALLGLPALLAVYNGAATALAHRVARPGVARILALAAAWGLAEWLRGHMLTGFPWVLIGYTWSGDALPLLAGLQWVSVIGIYGVSVATVLVAALPARLGAPDRSALAPLLGLAGLAAALGWGGLRLAGGPDPLMAGVTLRLVQPAFQQTAVSTRELEVARIQRLLAMAQSPGADKVTAQIWPEGSVGTFINLDTRVRQAIGAVAPANGLVITGTLRGEVDGQGNITQAWNNISAIDPSGTIVGSYDKFHLVPFGEYVPFHKYLQFNQIVARRFDFSTGPGPVTIPAGPLPPAGPIICYEAIFPHDVIDEAHRPGWILNVTNDAWFGTSTGPHQHFAIARTRAVEEGLPLVRAANTGISGVVDAHGRVLASLGLGRSGVLDVPLPAALPEATPYGRWGDDAFFVLIVVLGGAAVGVARRR
ncbi:apolipoprotein N-acyltransferase [Aliidongia dinghuensis]|uniref:Apolipoprotein N-acyltransferase n=1 Tax=Aliidongia dinghuensis TaxID=1867774 RepID=A0A8J2YPD4_9PROT|nr:apolipoprotein N-acyltransferase [Aliidongia dinghuensis]GGE99665.1 apolipoprotein N-acyltransferase [Aliidongia dinghuensis]